MPALVLMGIDVPFSSMDVSVSQHMGRLVGAHDPFISLHDDWQTTTLIASYYSSYDRFGASVRLN